MSVRGFMRCATGEMSEKYFEICCLQSGYDVARPVSHRPYDYLVDRQDGEGFLRVQVKSITRGSKDGAEYLRMSIAPQKGKYTSEDIDLLVGVDEQGYVYEFSVEEITDRCSLGNPVAPKYKTKMWFTSDRLWN